MRDRDAEVVVVGAAFAGLAAAQVLGRAQRDVVVLGSGPTRNAEAEHAHNVLTREGTPPGELIRLARAEVELLPTVRLEEAFVSAVEIASDDQLRVGTADAAAVTARHVILATGARDELPDVPGLATLWGRRAHSCPFCDGEPYAGRRVIVIADGEKAGHLQSILAGWTHQLTAVEPSAIAALNQVGDEVVAHMHDGRELVADGVFVAVVGVPRLDSVANLPLARRGPYLAVDGDGRTSIPWLWAAGDCAWRAGDGAPGGQVIAAMAAGAAAARWIVLDRVGVKPPDPPPVVEPVV